MIHFLPLTPEHLPAFEARLAKLTDATRPAWGRMTPAGMMAHLSVLLEAGLERRRFTPPLMAWVFRLPGMFPLMHGTLPWPKGMPTPREISPGSDQSVQAERERLVALMGEFTQRVAQEGERRVIHPAFGPLPLRRWAINQGLHFEHHLRQFGV